MKNPVAIAVAALRKSPLHHTLQKTALLPAIVNIKIPKPSPLNLFQRFLLKSSPEYLVNSANPQISYDIQFGNRYDNNLGNHNYFENASEKLKKEILSSFKNASIRLNLLKNILENKALNIKSFEDLDIYNRFIELKISLTDSPFGEKKPVYSDDTKAIFDSKYQNLLNQILHCKISFFSI